MAFFDFSIEVFDGVHYKTCYNWTWENITASVKHETISDDLSYVVINLENIENEVYIYLSKIQYVSLLYTLYFYSIYLYINISVDFNTPSL